MTTPLTVPLATNSVLATTAFWPGGSGMLVGVAGTWNSNVVTLNQLGPDGGTWIPLTITLSANGEVAFNLPQGQIKLTQSSTSTALYVSAEVVETNLN